MYRDKEDICARNAARQATETEKRVKKERETRRVAATYIAVMAAPFLLPFALSLTQQPLTLASATKLGAITLAAATTFGAVKLYNRSREIGKQRTRTAGKILGALIGLPVVSLFTLAALAQTVRYKENAIDKDYSKVASKGIHVGIKADTQVNNLDCFGIPLLAKNNVLKKGAYALILGKREDGTIRVRSDDNYFFNHQFQTCVFDVKNEDIVVPKFLEERYAQFLSGTATTLTSAPTTKKNNPSIRSKDATSQQKIPSARQNGKQPASIL